MAPPVPARQPDDDRRSAPPSLLYLTKQLELAVRAHLDELLRPAAITVLQYTALTVLERRSNLTTAELARNSFVTDQAMADMVTGLDDRGLIARDTDPRDRRRRVIRLTPKGERLLDRFRGPVAALEAQMIYRLTGEQADQLRHHLITCHASLTDTPPRRVR
jgi:DNA-binding MarR family transcriptional regulator